METETIINLSPSGMFKLILVRKILKSWKILSATIQRADASGQFELLGSSTGTYPSFQYQFFNQKGQEWLWYRLRYTQQHFVNLETGQIYTSPVPDAFCWAKLHFNPEGTLVAVEGCIWAAPYELRFYDLSDPAKGWPEIRIESCPFYEFYLHDDATFNWIDETTFEFQRTQTWSGLFNQPFDSLNEAQFEMELSQDSDFIEKDLYRVVLRLETGAKSEVPHELDLGTLSAQSSAQSSEQASEQRPTLKMIYETIEPSPIYLEQIEIQKIHQAKVTTFNQNFPNNNRYRALKEAFPESSVYLFYYKGAHQDVDSPIEAVHFGLNVRIGKDVYSIQSYSHKTTVALGACRARRTALVHRFETIGEVLAYLEAQRECLGSEL